MKIVLKLSLAVLLLVTLMPSASAQKMGYVNSQELIGSLPETDSMQVKLDSFAKELGEMLEGIQVEYNNKVQDYQNNLATMSESVRGIKEKELVDLQGRYEEFQGTAQQDLQKEQAALMQPIIEKARAAINKVSKNNSLVAVFDISTGPLAYYDSTVMVNVLPLVKKHLGVK